MIMSSQAALETPARRTQFSLRSLMIGVSVVIQDALGLCEAICEVPGLTVFRHGVRERFYHCYGQIEDARRHWGLDVGTINDTVGGHVAKCHDRGVASVLS